MHYSVPETLREDYGLNKRGDLRANVLRGRAWLEHALLLSQVSEEKFADQYIYRGRSNSKLVKKWKSGQVEPQRRSAVQLEKLIPGTLHIFDHSVFALLQNRPMSESEINGHLKPYVSSDSERRVWKFQYDAELADSMYAVPNNVEEFDTYNLRKRGDLPSFTVMVGLVRIAEARRDAELHVYFCKELYRAMPSVLRIPCLRSQSKLLKEVTDAIRQRMHFSWVLFDVDWNVVERQAAQADYEPIPGTRRRRGFVNYVVEDPILPAQFPP